MMVIIMEKVPGWIRGELTRWLLEPRSGVYVGHVSALVRDMLWEKCCKACKEGGILQIWTTNNEQHCAMRMYGEMERELVEMEGLQLIRVKEKK